MPEPPVKNTNNRLDLESQEKNWNALKSHINETIYNLTEHSLIDSLERLLQVNFIIGEQILIHSIVESIKLGDKGKVLGALIYLLNTEVPDIIQQICNEIVKHFVFSYNRNINSYIGNFSSALSYLFNYGILHEVNIFEILLMLMEDINRSSSDIIVSMIENCSLRLQLIDNLNYDLLYEKMRELLQDPDRKIRIYDKRNLERLFAIRRDGLSKPVQLISLPKLEQKVHLVTFQYLDFNKEKCDLKFNYFEDSPAIDLAFEQVKKHLLNILPTIVKDESEKTKSENGNTMKNELNLQDMTENQEIEFKKKIYLILKSSLSGDEAAHKLIKLQVPDRNKSKVLDIVIKSSLQESTYSKYYSIICERLCNQHKIWKESFHENFQKNYNEIEEFEPNQLRILGKFWGHLISSDYIGMEIFQLLIMNEEHTNASSRIFLKFLFQELVGELGINELKLRLSEDYIKPFVKGLFPMDKDNVDDMKYSINYFTAIGLGVLTDEMREKLQIIKAEEEIKQERIRATLEEEQNVKEGEGEGGQLIKKEEGEEVNINIKNEEAMQDEAKYKTFDSYKRWKTHKRCNSRYEASPRNRQRGDRYERNGRSRYEGSSRYNNNTNSARDNGDRTGRYQGNKRSRTPPRERRRSRTPPRNRQ
ncbi:hypothetical protein TBLA_0C07040 [Henningerozyma blattae CBS 6284]|uniref:Pre-mRNA-splicing factor CWC22 n=1 Tax=Henningerozyma blattae (strain ATCC 34711 / CBS 6284 / DSM 70876 / NBRC 10599 / NRRL Y-10934 / UCD 77-7) TaxID=1071380 RepID=I2H293_HENB6|nr:hypothetical protein TBLA_0C07040 [Tetrapisispora blattae CBS 6284]CCH60495.1 hypothetical protein TBLA_0C07040 [Tetrapisispora blattae CBS 6284]